MMELLWKATLSGGILILVITLLRLLTARRIPRDAFLFLWGTALLRLLFPFSIPSPVSIYTYASRVGLTLDRPGLLTENAPPLSPAGPGSLLPLLYLAGVVFFAAFFLADHLRLRSRYRAALPIESAAAAALLDACPLRRTVRLKVSDQISSPFTSGVLHPVIFLPKALEHTDEATLDFVLRHELFHIRRFDVLWKWLLAAAVCLHWFNPLVYVFYTLAGQDMELSCDAHVVRQSPADCRGAYARTLVTLEEKLGSFSPFFTGFSKNAMDERILSIMRLKKTSVLGVGAALLLVLGVILPFATSALPTASALSYDVAAEAETGVIRTALVSSVADETVETAYTVAGSGDAIFQEQPGYSPEQYDALLAALRYDGWENSSIAAFNRRTNAAFSADPLDGNWENSVSYLYDRVLCSLPDDDPAAPFLRNTVMASLEEYQARLEEAASGEKVSPSFSGFAQSFRCVDVFGDAHPIGDAWCAYTFTYRILDQDSLTVSQRDAFLQTMLQAAQDYLDSADYTDSDSLCLGLQKTLRQAGEAASTAAIAYEDCRIQDCTFDTWS